MNLSFSTGVECSMEVDVDNCTPLSKIHLTAACYWNDNSNCYRLSLEQDQIDDASKLISFNVAGESRTSEDVLKVASLLYMIADNVEEKLEHKRSNNEASN